MNKNDTCTRAKMSGAIFPHEQQPQIQTYGEETLKNKIKKMSLKKVLTLVTIGLCLAFLLAIFVVVMANKELQSDYNTKCGQLCMADGYYRYNGETCTCLNRLGEITANYYVEGMEFIRVGE